jgi:hypothetical protein
MKGPKPDPHGEASNLFFVCERCGTTVMDRRKPMIELRREARLADRRKWPPVGPGRK